MKKRILSMLLLLALLSSIASVTVFALSDKENNNTVAKAQAFTLGNTINGSITRDDIDMYAFKITKSGRITLDFTSYMRYYSVYLYDKSGTELWYDDSNEWNSTVGFRNDVHIIDLEKGTYYLKVTGYRYNTWDASTGTYSIKTSFTASNATEKEPNNSVAAATQIALHSANRGLIGVNDRYDFYKFTLTEAKNLPLSVTSYMRYYSIYLYDETGSQRWYDDSNERNSTTGFRTDNFNIQLDPGTYYLKVTGYRYNTWDASTGVYSLFLDISASDVTNGKWFYDVSGEHWFYDEVMWAVGEEVTNGVDATHFAPDATCTRNQVVTFLWRAQGSPEPKSTYNPFVDVKETDYFYDAVLWAVEKGITNGIDATHFKPNDECTRGQVVTFLYRAAGNPVPKSTNNSFADVKQGEYYYTPVLWAVGEKITTGITDTTFEPETTCTRAQIVTFLSRAYQ